MGSHREERRGRAQREGGRPPVSRLLEAELCTKPLKINK